LLFPDPAGYHSGSSHAQADGDRIDQRNDRLGQAYRSHCLPADPPDKKDIDNGKDGFHAHFEDHWDR
jgi:hypothetical protein